MYDYSLLACNVCTFHYAINNTRKQRSHVTSIMLPGMTVKEMKIKYVKTDGLNVCHFPLIMYFFVDLMTRMEYVWRRRGRRDMIHWGDGGMRLSRSSRPCDGCSGLSQSLWWKCDVFSPLKRKKIENRNTSGRLSQDGSALWTKVVQSNFVFALTGKCSYVDVLN